MFNNSSPDPFSSVFAALHTKRCYLSPPSPECRLEGAQERDQILLFLRRKLRAEDEVEELDRVLGTKLERRSIK
jgi:hypothetical protein